MVSYRYWFGTCKWDESDTVDMWNKVFQYNDGYEGLDLNSRLRLSERCKVFCTSAHIELTWHNEGSLPVEFDVYTMVYKRQPITEHDSLLSAFLDGSASAAPIQNIVSSLTPPITSPKAVPNLGNRGVTPFDVPQGIKLSGGLVIRSERFVISPGQVITKTHRDSRHRTLYIDDDSNLTECFQKKGWTISFLTLYRCHGGTANQLVSHRQTKSYRWNIEGVKTPKVSYTYGYG